MTDQVVGETGLGPTGWRPAGVVVLLVVAAAAHFAAVLTGAVLLQALFFAAMLGALVLAVFSFTVARRHARERAVATTQAKNELVLHRSTLDALHEGIIVFDEAGKVQGCNGSAERILRRSLATMQSFGLANWRVIEPSGQAVAVEDLPVQRCLATGRPQTDRLLGDVSDSGTVAWLRVSAVPARTGATGSAGGAVVTFVDVTERTLADAELAAYRRGLEEMVHARTVELERLNAELTAARDKAEAATRAKSAFLANMSHEIRTPMNAIIGLTHLMRRDSLAPHHMERLARVTEAASHLLEIINNILDLSKIESGKVVLEKADFSLGALIERACGLVAEAASEKGLELSTSTDATPAVLRGDAMRISQALANLLSNAVKFTEWGSIQVRTSVLQRQGEQVLVRFEVEDTGIGVEPERLESVFKAFEQADTTTTRRFGGTGLGLGIARYLARLMGGDAGGSSEPGVGSTFWFSARLEVGEARGETGEQGPLSGRHALVVDDLADAREHLVNLLRDLGMRTSTAVSGEQALEIFSAAKRSGDPYDVVLIDWLMPHMDGIETARRLLAEHAPDPPSCVLVSGLPDARMSDQALALGITTILQKPLSLQTLREHLGRELLGKAHGAEQEAGAAEASVRKLHTGARVLLAEDNPVNQEVAKTLLEVAGLEVSVAKTGREALDEATKQHFDLILMDMQMPEVDGPQSARLLRARPATAGVPIVAMTANAYAEDRATCLAAGMNDYLTKPVEPHLLYEVLVRWLPQVGDRVRQCIDAERGLAFFGGKSAVHARALGQFAALYADGIPLAGNYAASPGPDTAEALRRELHSIAGAAATLGARLIAEQSAALGKRLRDEPEAADTAAAVSSLQGSVSALVAAIQSDALARSVQ